MTDSPPTDESAPASTLASEDFGREPVLPYFVAGIGASAGGLEALTEFFSAAKKGAGIAYVVVQHLSPDFKSMMVELLSRHTPLEVTDVTQGQTPQPDAIYLLPPKRTLLVEDGKFVLDERDPSRVVLPINVFLESLAREQRELCAGVILSGTGTDGTHGCRQIKEAGGLVLAQEPGTAKFDGMPRSVITTNLADQVGGPAALCQSLASYAQHPIVRSPALQKDRTEQEAVAEIIRSVHHHTKIDFGLYKRGTVTRRIQRRTSLLGLSSVEEYAKHLADEPNELELLSREMLIGVTQFFRDPEVWQNLKQSVIPEILAAAPDHTTIRAWCSGCATGEEAYTLAILLQEVLRASNRPVSYRLFATDARQDSLTFARAAAYPVAACEMIPQRLRDRYLEAHGDHYVVRRSLRDSITFAQHDILSDPPFTQLNLISCRNMLIYFSHEAQQRAFARFRHSLVDGGIMLLGLSESVGDANASFQTLDKRTNTYIARGTPPPSTALMVTPSRMSRGEELFPRNPSRTNELLYGAIISRQCPPTLAVDTNLDIVQSLGDVSRFLRFPQGRVSVNLLKMVPQAVAVLLNSAARNALSQDEEVCVPDVYFQQKDEKLAYTVRITPLLKTSGLPATLLVFFEQQERRPSDIVGNVDIDVATRQRLHQLEDELTIAREHLHSAVQDLEATNEELQATNEELTVSNEELQSTNEELQSVNEELYTVNTEYQQKIGELEELNADLENLLRVMAAGVVFLDDTLCIRRYNEASTHLLPMRREDLGRPLKEIAVQAAYPTLATDAQQVLASGQRTTRKILGDDGTWWSIVMRVFQASADDPRGVIITLQEVSELTRASSELRRLERAQDMAEEIAGFGYAILDFTNEQVRFSSGARRLLGMEAGRVTLDSALAVFAPEARERMKEGMDLIKGGLDVPFTVKRELVRADGTKVPVKLSVQSKTDTETGARLLFAVFRAQPE